MILQFQQKICIQYGPNFNFNDVRIKALSHICDILDRFLYILAQVTSNLFTSTVDVGDDTERCQISEKLIEQVRK